MTEDEMVGWHRQLDGHEFEQTPRDSEGQGSLECCSPRGHKESNTTENLNDNKVLLVPCHKSSEQPQGRKPDLRGAFPLSLGKPGPSLCEAGGHSIW